MIDSREPLHNYTRSHAVVMGTSEYRYLAPVSAAANSLKRMVNLLTGQLCGWPEDRVLVWAEQINPGNLADRLITVFENVVDIALFYYVGHGQIDLEDQLCLGLVESRTEPNRRATTSLGFQAVRRALLDSPAAIKIIILDCCFSGLASQSANTLGSSNEELSNIIGGTGAYTMVASGAYNTAWYEIGQEAAEPHTYFTRYLAELIEEGIPDGGPVIDLHSLFTGLYHNLARDKLPVPSSRSIDGAREFPFAYNAAETESHQGRLHRIRFDLDIMLDQINHRLAEAEAKGKVLDARLDERSRQLEELRQQVPQSQQTVDDQRQLPRAEMASSTIERRRKTFPLLRNGAFTPRRLVIITVVACVATATIFLASSLVHPHAPRTTGPQRHFVGRRVNAWTYQTAGLVYSGPMVADGTVYVGSGGGIYALNAATGSLRWADASVGAVDSSPKVVGDSVYIGCFSPHAVFALDAATGHVRWSYVTERPIESSPFVVGGTVYIGSFDGKVYALSAVTGHVRWTHTTGGPIESSPFVESGILYIGSDDHQIYALNTANGSVRWIHGTDDIVKSSPVVSDGSLFIGSDDDRIYALNAASGHLRWTYATGGRVDSSAFVAHGTVYIGSDDHRVYALNKSTGHLDWSYIAKGAVRSRPIVADGTLYVGSFDEKIYALNAAAGPSQPGAGSGS